MRNKVAGKLFATVALVVAAVLALGGGVAVAAAYITSADIVNRTIRAWDMSTGSVNSRVVANRSLRQKDFRAGALFLGALPSGKTLRGTFGMYGHGEVNDGLEAASESISFPIPLSSVPSVKVVQQGTASSPPECPGTADDPKAAPGWLCVYENRAQNQRPGSYPSVVAPGSGFSPSASRFGATLIVQGQASGTDWFFWSEGTWAVTAP